MLRVFIATIVGGLVVFTWGFVSHMFLGLGDSGMYMDKLPGEQALRDAMTESLPESGLYWVPGMDRSITDAAQQWDEAIERSKSGPAAFIVLQRDGVDGGMGKQLGLEAATNLAGAFLASLMVLGFRGPFIARIVLVGSLGLFAWVTVDASQVIWYAFPREFGFAQLIDHVVGWTLAGIGIALIIKPRRKPAAEG